MKRRLDAEMDPAPTQPCTIPLNGMHPPARAEATHRWISPQNSDYNTDIGGSNVGIYFVPREGQQTTEKLPEWQIQLARNFLAPPSPPPSSTPYQSALKDINYCPISPPAAPRWLYTPLPPELPPPRVRLQTKPKAPLQARPHDRWLTTVEDPDIESDDLLAIHLKGWPLVTNVPDIEVVPSLKLPRMETTGAPRLGTPTSTCLQPS